MKIKTFVSASLGAVTVLACSLSAREAHAQRVVVEPAARPVVGRCSKSVAASIPWSGTASARHGAMAS
jgi:hypothetical protein